MFVATANTLDTISPPLLDRCEVIECSGYVTDEKLAIAKRFLLPRQITECGLDASAVDIGDEALLRVILEYTREVSLFSTFRALHQARSRSHEIEVEVEDEDEDDVMGEADNEVAAEVPVQEEPIEVEVRTKKSTKSKKKGAVVEDANDVEEGEDTPPAAENTPPAAEDTTYDDTKSQPKKRRHRLESVLTKTSSPPDEDDAHLRKHGAILNNFQKASKRSQALQSQAKDVEPTEVEFSQPTVQDLEMPDADLPPPYDDDDDDEEEVTSNLPSWLAKPTVISADSKATFVSLNLAPKTLAHLSALKFDDALPVQQALIPLLLPAGTPGSSFKTGTEMILPDLAVSAATGSGKTLAYLLPVIESLKVHSIRGRLTALVVVPTRELVQQVAAVAESLSKGSGLRVGMATGSGKFVDEQRKLVKSGFQYAPNSSEADDDEVNITECINEDYLACPPNHKVTHESALDILIATPGRLLEHLEHTKGFNLVHLQWFILDEADKLLDHQSAGEISSLLQHISRPRTAEEQDARERYLRQQGEWDERAERRVRKVLLSATMTRDVQRLTGLGLRFPKLIAVQQEVEEKKSGFEVPEGLREYVVPVGDGSEKPLVALEWLRTMIFGEKEERDEDEDSSDTDSDSSDSDSDSDSDSESGSDSPSSSSTVGHEDDVPAPAKKTPPTVLVFTATSESASRLSHLLRALKPAWEKNIHLLIKSHKNLPRFTSSSVPLIVVSTDRAARGLDSLSGRPISHVLQYDVPTSLTGYVHRVGRTARNGRDGEGWTLYARREAGWFLKAVGVETGGEGEGVKRRGLVERVKVFMKDDSIRERYAEVLGEMRGEVLGGGKAE